MVTLNQEGQEIIDSEERRRREHHSSVSANSTSISLNANNDMSTSATSTASLNNSGRNFTIQFNMNPPVTLSDTDNVTVPTTLGGESGTLRQRRLQPVVALQGHGDTSQGTAVTDESPVHARTIDRLPQNNPHAMGQARRVHVQRTNASRGQAVLVNVSNNNPTNHHGQQQQQQQQQPGYVPIRRVPAAAPEMMDRFQLIRRGPAAGRGIRVTPAGRRGRGVARGGGPSVRIVHNNNNSSNGAAAAATGRGHRRAGELQRRVQLPPLVPQPLPYHAPHPTDDNDSSSNTSEEGNEFKCLICFEFLQDPATCGKCDSRFCFACIRRVAEMAASVSAGAKCPTCRCVFSQTDIRRDDVLKDKMHNANTVKCQYQGCNVQLPLHQVADHERVCSFVPIKCRYYAFGCDWKGTRQELAAHESSSCALAKVSNLVQQFRQSRADHEHAISHLEQRVAASNAMMELHASLLQQTQKRPLHPGDILDLLYTVTCTPARYIWTKDVWRALTSCRLSRGFLCNLLAFLPTALLVLRIAATGFRELLQSDLHDLDSIRSGVVAMLYSPRMLVLFSFPLSVMLFIKLGKNSIVWAEFEPPIDQPNKLTVVMTNNFLPFVDCLVQSATMDCSGQFVGILVWMLVLSSSTFFPTLVLTLIESVNGVNRTRPTNVLTACRGLPSILFGLRIGAIFNLTGCIACLDAVLFQSLLRHYQPENCAPVLFEVDRLIHIETRDLLKYALVRTALTVGKWVYVGSIDYPFDSLVGFALLLTINYLVNNLIVLGTTIAKLVFEQAKQNVNQSGVRKVVNTAGCISFGAWLLFLCGILLSY